MRGVIRGLEAPTLPYTISDGGWYDNGLAISFLHVFVSVVYQTSRHVHRGTTDTRRHTNLAATAAMSWYFNLLFLLRFDTHVSMGNPFGKPMKVLGSMEDVQQCLDCPFRSYSMPSAAAGCYHHRGLCCSHRYVIGISPHSGEVVTTKARHSG